MEHSYFRDRISAFKDNGLNTEEQYLISLHLKECADCRALLEKLEALDSMVARESNLSPDEYFEKLANRIDKKIAGDSAKVTDISTRSSWAGLTWKITATAASVAFLVFIGYHKDDILPPSQSMSESPVIMAPGSTVKVDSIRTRRQDKAEEQPASFSSPKPSPAELRSPSAADGYFMYRDALGKNDDAQGDVGRSSSGDEQDLLKVKKSEVAGERKTITEQSSKGLFQEAAQKNERPSITFKLLEPKPLQDNAPELVDESDSNYKRARKSGQVLKEEIEDEYFADDSSQLGKKRDSLIFLDELSGSYSFRATRVPGPMMSHWRKITDSLLAAWPQYRNSGVKKLSAKSRSDDFAQLSQADRDKALEAELFALIQNILRVSKDSLETSRAVEILSDMSNYGISDIKEKAMLYLDSLNAARTKRDEERK